MIHLRFASGTAISATFDGVTRSRSTHKIPQDSQRRPGLEPVSPVPFSVSATRLDDVGWLDVLDGPRGPRDHGVPPFAAECQAHGQLAFLFGKRQGHLAIAGP